jgi:hypothetical protein
MQIDYRIVDGHQGGRTFSFVPCDHAFHGDYDHDCFGPDVFSVSEEAFLFIEGMVARSFPDWSSSYRHSGITWATQQAWLDILPRFSDLRRDITGNAKLPALVDKYVICPGLIPQQHKLHRVANIP